MLRYNFKDSISSFLLKTSNEIIGEITKNSQFDVTRNQNKSWKDQIPILKKALYGKDGTIFFEFSIPRMGKRVDVIAIVDNAVFVIEFKVGEKNFFNCYIDQVWDYALDLKNFHEPSHKVLLVPVLVSTESANSTMDIPMKVHNDNLLIPILVNSYDLRKAIDSVLSFFHENFLIDGDAFATGSYHPTPTIVEAAVSLYKNHSVEEITRSDAGAKNLSKTTDAISSIIEYAKSYSKKVICFVTGVPGAGKTLVGLKVATSHMDAEKKTASVYLSGNAPLVAILQEALTRDKVAREKEIGNKVKKSEVRESVKTFIQIIHHYRDAYLEDKKAPYDHVAIFDEAQRAWNKKQTIDFMKRKKGQPNFDMSESQFLISCLDRHKDWAVIVCLVGGGQEINTGEAGISEWLNAIDKMFPHWEVAISPNLKDSEYSAEETIKKISHKCVVNYNEDLHLGISMRSFRAENLSLFIKNLLDLNIKEAKDVLKNITDKYPIILTRDFGKAKDWIKDKARGTERYGLVVSSQAERLKPYAIDVKSPINPVYWFLNEKDDVRSSYYMEDVATEFHIQGLELDWVCVAWDGDLRFSKNGWQTYSFKGNKWQNINKDDRRKYLVNAYRVLLTRARQGMVIVVPEGNVEDHTRKPEYYNSTFEYLKSIGLTLL